MNNRKLARSLVRMAKMLTAKLRWKKLGSSWLMTGKYDSLEEAQTEAENW